MTGQKDSAPSFAGGAASAFAIQCAGLLLGWIVQIALARTLTRPDLGVLTTVSALTTTLAVPATLGLPVALVRFLPEYRAQGDWPHYRGILRGGAAAIGLAGVCVAGASVLVVWLSPASPALRGPLLAGAALIPAGALSAFGMQALRGQGRAAQAAWPPLLLQPALLLAALAALLGTGVRLDSRGSVLLLTAATLAALGVHLRLVARRTRLEAGPFFSPAAYELRLWLSVSAPLLLTAVFQMILAQTDILVVSFLQPPREVAVYGVAARLARLISLTQFAVYLALGPSLVEAHLAGRRDAVQQAVSAATRWTFWPACAMGLLLATGGPVLLSLYGSGFGTAYGPLCLLGAGFLVNAAAGPAVVLLNMTGHQYVVTKVSGLTAVGGVGLSLLLTAKFGLAGAAAASALAMAAWNLWLAWEAQSRLQVRALVGTQGGRRPRR